MGYDGKYGNQQSYGNKNGSSGGFQKTFEDKTEIPEPVKIQSFYKDDGKTLKEDLFDSVALDVAKSFKGKNKKGKRGCHSSFKSHLLLKTLLIISFITTVKDGLYQ